VSSPITTSLGELAINLLSRFSWHVGRNEGHHFLEQRRRIMTIVTPISTGNKTTKVKRLREDGFYIFLFFFCLGFVLWWVLCFMLLSSLEKNLSPRF
jgi:hypothetical protein